MKALQILTFLFISTISFGQFAIIQDKDGYCNVRSSPETGNNVTDKLKNGQMVFLGGRSGNWTHISYTVKKNELDGHVYHDRLKMISDYQIIPQTAEGKNDLTYSKDSLKIVVTQQGFDKSKYKFTYYKDSPRWIELINGKQYWGTDGEMPKSEYKSVIALIGQRKISLPRSAIENLFEPSLYSTEVHYDKANDILYIESMNSDGAGAYGVIWKIERGVYKERFIMYGF